jgi:hypothetical protein
MLVPMAAMNPAHLLITRDVSFRVILQVQMGHSPPTSFGMAQHDVSSAKVPSQQNALRKAQLWQRSREQPDGIGHIRPFRFPLHDTRDGISTGIWRCSLTQVPRRNGLEWASTDWSHVETKTTLQTFPVRHPRSEH